MNCLLPAARPALPPALPDSRAEARLAAEPPRIGTLRRLALAAAAALWLAGCSGDGDDGSYATGEARHMEGTLSSGGRYTIDVPANWNGSLYVFSVGYISTALAAGQPARNATDDTTKAWLLDQGYALAGSQPVGLGWAVAEILPDQAEIVRDVFPAQAGRAPRRTIAWGNSMGGLISAGLVQQYPALFQGALPLCASVAGGPGMLNQALDAAFAFKTLLAPGDATLQLTNYASAAAETAATARAKQVLDAAQLTPQGRARIALAAAFAQLSTWSTVGDAEPGPTDWQAQETQQYKAFMFAVFSPRQPLEARAGGNFSWNTGVDYRAALARSGRAPLVAALYQAAGLSLDADLDALAAAPRIAADASAVDYMRRNLTPTGDMQAPVLTLHETGDNAPTVTQVRAYAEAVAAKGNQDLLRNAFVHRPGHCAYTPAERAALVKTLEKRLDGGHWDSGTTAASLNALAAQIKAASPRDLGTAAFVDYLPDRFLRPFYP